MLVNGSQFIPCEKASSASRIKRRLLAPLRRAVLSFSRSLVLFVPSSLFLSISLFLSLYSISFSLRASIFVALYFKLSLTKLYSSVTNDHVSGCHVPRVYFQLSLSHDICYRKFCTPRPMHLFIIAVPCYGRSMKPIIC